MYQLPKNQVIPSFGSEDNFKKTCLQHVLWAKILIQEIQLSPVFLYEFLTSCQDLEKTNNPIPRKCPDRQTKGWPDNGRWMNRPYFDLIF